MKRTNAAFGLNPGILFCVAVVALAAAAALLHDRVQFSPDSWTYRELANSVFGDFYRINHRRSFDGHSPYNASFPPLWPVLLALVEAATGAGPKAAFFVAVASFIPFAWLSERTARSLYEARWVGLTAAALTALHLGYWRELIAGRTMPLQMCLYALLAFVLVRRPLSLVSAGQAGIVAGIAVLNRFDALPLALALPFLLLLVRASWRVFLAYVAGLGAALSPWIYFSWTRLGTPFASDNGGTALMTDRRAFVTDWWPTLPTTAFEDPLGWIEKVGANLAQLPLRIFWSPSGPALLCYGLLLAAVVVLARRLPNPRSGSAAQRLWTEQRMAIILLLAILSMLASNIVTGYFDARYFVPLWWLVLLVSLGSLAQAVAAERRGRVMAAVAAASLILVPLITVPRSMKAPRLATFPAKDMDRALAACLPGNPRDQAILGFEATEAARLSALYGWRTMLAPANLARLDPAAVRQFLTLYDVTFVHLGSRARPLWPQSVKLAPLAGCPAGWFVLPGKLR